MYPRRWIVKVYDLYINAWGKLEERQGKAWAFYERGAAVQIAKQIPKARIVRLVQKRRRRAA